VKTVAFRIIPKEREWVVKPIEDGVVLDKPISSHTSRAKALHCSLRKVFADNSGRRAFNLILEGEDETLVSNR